MSASQHRFTSGSMILIGTAILCSLFGVFMWRKQLR
jgi:hypothetical protein